MIQVVRFIYSLFVIMLAFGLLAIVALGLAYGLEKIVDRWIPLSLFIGGLFILVIVFNYVINNWEKKSN